MSHIGLLLHFIHSLNYPLFASLCLRVCRIPRYSRDCCSAVAVGAVIYRRKSKSANAEDKYRDDEDVRIPNVENVSQYLADADYLSNI
jgi:hypothetical protein